MNYFSPRPILLLFLAVSVAQAQDTPTEAVPDPIPPALENPAKAANPKKLDFIERSNFVFSKLIKNNRALDPFGQQMDPGNAKETPVLAEQYEELEETPVLNNSSLKSALLTLPITGVYPHRNLIVIGARSVPSGGIFGMKLQELTIRLRFEGIRGKQVFFKDLETQEVTSIEYNPLPAEFEPLTSATPRGLGEGIVPMNELFIAN